MSSSGNPGIKSIKNWILQKNLNKIRLLTSWLHYIYVFVLLFHLLLDYVAISNVQFTIKKCPSLSIAMDNRDLWTTNLFLIVLFIAQFSSECLYTTRIQSTREYLDLLYLSPIHFQLFMHIDGNKSFYYFIKTCLYELSFPCCKPRSVTTILWRIKR